VFRLIERRNGQPAPPRRFVALDGWRGISAVLVGLYHVEIIGEIYAGHWRALPVIENAYLFVDFFFVLSGFVIAHTYERRIAGGDDLLAFATRRFGRVWPLHLAVLLGFIAFELVKLMVRARGIATESAPFAGSFAVSAIVTNLLLVQSFGLHHGLTWNQPSWSIGVEFYAYLVFAVLVLLARRRLVPAAALIAALGALAVAICSPTYMRTTFDYGFFRCLYGFFLGVLVHRFYDWADLAPRLQPTAVEIAAVAAVVAFVSVAGAGPVSLLSPLIFAVAVYVFALERGALSWLLLMRPFRAAGAWSYSIYMVQALLLIVIARAIRTVEAHFGGPATIEANVEGSRQMLLSLGSPWRADALVLLYLVLLLAIASITFRFIETPARAFFNAAARRVQQGSAEPRLTDAA
jgi:peptidoglycan/LPS O-acetylase OafA/YrhL